MQKVGSLALLFVVQKTSLVCGFASPQIVAERQHEAAFRHQHAFRLSSSGASSTSEIRSDYSYDTLFDFADSEKGADAVSKFDRIDDAIMGGISTSSLRLKSCTEANGTDDSSYASWSGVCRLDGGGFCGTRTLPFVDGKPLEVGADKEGLFLVVKLASDDEPERRVWKVTTRNLNNARSEQLYQAEFQIQKKEGGKSDSGWETIRVPFSSFVQVRGPRVIENGPPLDPTGGLFQIGMSLSKFQIASNTTELPNFRPGYFELQIREIGLYGTASSKAAQATTSNIQTLTKKEAEQQRPAALKILLPLLKLFFSEQRNRQKSATRLLKARGLNQLEIAVFGIRRKATSKGMVLALADFFMRLSSTTVRLSLFWTLKLALFYPLVTTRKIARKLAAVFSKKPTAQGSDALGSE
ncbi:unnamed protein product [Pseudo-nitzschia multistriata]|uniref:NADH:ubiquinone oxidoreductase intermediate-associated protein 30 domain-containing protein n=1 Tax=Pseudo-nitzschia multistriata TaxID=183589 RepID=A0A448ZCQ8_9STRA|nr:unnamed protein product [Pseudo-nitzschia multistriata]